MKVLSTNPNQNSPIYSQNRNSTQNNVNFEANWVLSPDEKIFKKLAPEHAKLIEVFWKTKFGRACRTHLTKFFKDVVFEKIGMAKKEIFIDADEQKELVELITKASLELNISTQKQARPQTISAEEFNLKWNSSKTDCAKLKKYVEGLIKGAEDVDHDVMKEHWGIREWVVEFLQESFQTSIAKKPVKKS